ncbi:MAG TPA: hypothetical protein VHE78_07440 [Gemmatimonadaceae bacterium]|nr:hypothetical protein [Gemmatimonadaceae bacterium]
MLDELLEEVNRRAPGFGGMYRGKNGELDIWITPKGNRVAIEAAARTVFHELDWENVRSVVFRPGQFEVLELQALRARVPASFARSLIWTDFDEMSNRVTIGVDRSADVSSLASAMVALGARPGMLAIVQDDRPKQMDYIYNAQRPVVGGLLIDVADSAGTEIHNCTLGFNAKLSGDQSLRYFVTASHCTSTFAAVDHDTVYQAFKAFNPIPIGFEVQDPAMRTDIPGCPTWSSNRKCRYSDAALFQFTSADLSNFPYLAMDSSVSSTLGVNGSRFRVDSFVVIADYPEARLLAADTVNHNTWLMKVGMRSGWTWGPISRTCFDVGAGGGALRCQYQVLAEADEGDSGAPVFEYTSLYYTTKQATLAGIVRGGFSGLNFDFSSISGIKNDIANLITY